MPDAPPHAAAPPGLLLRGMERWYGFWRRHRAWFVLLLAVATAASVAASAHVRWNGNILAFFSGNSALVRDARNAGSAAGVIRFDLHGAGGQKASLEVVRRAAAALAAQLKGSGGFQNVFYRLSLRRQERAGKVLFAQAAWLCNSADRARLRRRMAPKALAARFAGVAANLAAPDAPIALARLVRDPLGISGLLAARYAAINPQRNGRLRDGMLFSADGRHCMAFAIPRPLAHLPGARRRLVGLVHNAVAAVERQYPRVHIWWVAPVRNFVHNELRTRRDVARIGLIGSAAVVLAVLLYFRRPASVLLCVLPPFAGIGTALGIAGLFHLRLPLLALGFSGLLLGSTTDYGIQLMAAASRLLAAAGGQWREEQAALAARDLFGAISMSVATSVTGYGALVFSGAWGLRWLGLFVAGATLGIYGITFLVLPVFLGPWTVRVTKPRPARAARRRPGVLRAGYVVATLALAAAGASMRFNYHLAAFDGSGALVHRQMAGFFRVWGNLRQQALVQVTGPTAGAALSRLQKAAEMLRADVAAHRLAAAYTPAAVLPSSRQVVRRLAAWRRLFSRQRIAAVRRAAVRVARANGMRGALWRHALRGVVPAAPAGAAARLQAARAVLLPGVVQQNNRGVAIACALQLPAGNVGRVPKWIGLLRRAVPGVRIISGSLMLAAATHRARQQFRWLLPLVVCLILVPMGLFFRGLRRTLIASISLFAGCAWLFGVAQVLGGGLNLLAVVPLLFTLGVAVDYGIYAASDPALQAPEGSMGRRTAATALCASTTMLGSGAMVLAAHPMLRWIGLMLVAGVCGGYLAAWLLVEPLVAGVSRRQ